jgi:molecular chaperone HtpG
MSALNGGMNFYGSLPESYTVTVNFNHPAIKKILTEKEEKLSARVNEIDAKLTSPKETLEKFNEKIKGIKDEDMDKADRDERERLEGEIEKVKQERKDLMAGFGKENQLIRQVCDLALLSNGMLKGEELNKFVKRSLSLIS